MEFDSIILVNRVYMQNQLIRLPSLARLVGWLPVMMVVVMPRYSSSASPVHNRRASSRSPSGLDRREIIPLGMLEDSGYEPGVRWWPREPDEASRRNRTSGRSVVSEPAVMPSPASTLLQMEI